MILTEMTSVAAVVLPVGLLRDHLRLGTGFAEDGLQDSLLEAYLRAAISAIQGRTGCVLLNTTFSWGLTRWRHYDRQVLPVHPVNAVQSVTLIDQAGGEIAVGSSQFRLVKDSLNPAIAAVGLALPSVPRNGSVDVVFDAGYGAVWGDVPEDLARAVLLLAANFYENRATQDAASLPPGVLALLERFRPVRIFGGV